MWQRSQGALRQDAGAQAAHDGGPDETCELVTGGCPLQRQCEHRGDDAMHVKSEWKQRRTQDIPRGSPVAVGTTSIEVSRARDGDASVAPTSPAIARPLGLPRSP